jgi:transcriptional regulator with XRE-family HTH domain
MEMIAMKVNGELVRQRRIDMGWTQDQLAKAAKLNLRTVQRIESGSGANLETVADLAAVLRVPNNQLIAIGEDVPEGPDVISMHRMDGALELVRASDDAETLVIDCLVEPRQEFCEELIAMIETMEALDPHPVEWGDMSRPTYPSVSEKIRLTASLTAKIEKLAGHGVYVHCGSYMTMGQRLRWDNDEGHWYTMVKQREEPLKTVVVQISSSSAPKLNKRVKDRLAPEARGDAPTESGDDFLF